MSRPTTITEPTDLLTLREDLTLPEIERRAGVIYAGTGLRHRALAHYLHLVERRGLHQTAGYRTAAQWAAGRLGMSVREARDLLAAGRALPELPLIDRAFAEGRLWWTKVRQLIKVATPQHEEAWLRKACELTTDELVLEVRLSKAGQAPRSRDDRKGLPEVRLQLGASMPPDVYAMWEQVRRKATDEAGRRTQEWECLEAAFRAYLSQSDDGPDRRVTNSPYTVIVNDSRDAELNAEIDTEDGPVPVSELTRSVLRCDGHHVSDTRPNGKGKAEIPAWLRRRVLARDRHRCRRCRGRDSLHLHHIIPEESGGPTEYDNLLVLCRYCHTLVHADFIQIEGSVRKDLRFVDPQGCDLQAAEVVPAESYEALTGGDVAVLQLPEPTGHTEHLGLEAPTNGKAERGTACRPAGRFGDLIGQAEVIEGLDLSVEVARKLGEPLGHTLLVGAPGLGKTTLARAVAGELGARMHATNGSLLQTPSDIVSALAALEARDVLFVDEIHAIPRPVAEVLYEAMDHWRTTVQVDVAGKRHGVPLRLAPFTLIGATTEHGSLPDPFVSRFENVEYLRFYEPHELAALIDCAAGRQGLQIAPKAAAKLATVARQTPRQALILLKQVRKRAVRAGRTAIDEALVEMTLERLGIDERGLTPIDRRCLDVLAGCDAAVPLERLAQLVGIDAEALKRRHEPYLFQLGLVSITPRGRVIGARDRARAHSGCSRSGL